MFQKKRIPPPTSDPQDSVATAERELQAARDKAQRLQYQPPPVRELLVRIPAFVDACAAQCLTDDGLRFVHALSDNPDPCAIPFGSATRVTFGALCVNDRAVAIRLLTSIVERCNYAPGPAASERARVVEQARAAVDAAAKNLHDVREARLQEIEEATGMPRQRVEIEPRSVGEGRPLTLPIRRRDERVTVRTLHGNFVSDD